MVEALPGAVGGGQRLAPWFDPIARRLSRVFVLNRSWRSGVTPTVLMQTPNAPKGQVAGVFLDPPYKDTSDTYKEDDPDAARDTYTWAVEHGEQYRIAYCCKEGDFDVPSGWDTSSRTFSGYVGTENCQKTRDLVMYSPACVGQRRLI